MEIASYAPELTRAQFQRICRLIYERCGIALRPGKEALVRSRLTHRLLRLGLSSFDHYVDLIEQEGVGTELRAMIDALTTNKTSFFREPQHFAYLREKVLPGLIAAGGPLRFWSAGCSSGEEAYSLAIVLCEEIPAHLAIDSRILATDISDRVLAEARQAVYPGDRLEDVPPEYLKRYFVRDTSGPAPAFAVGARPRSMVRLARLNLMEEWPMRGLFDAVFCRNVMIYFDLPTRRQLVQRFWQLLKPGGHLFVGHSESLTQSSPEFHYILPAVYRKRDVQDPRRGRP